MSPWKDKIFFWCGKKSTCPHCGSSDIQTVECVADEDIKGNDILGNLGLISIIRFCNSCKKRISKKLTGSYYGPESLLKKPKPSS